MRNREQEMAFREYALEVITSVNKSSDYGLTLGDEMEILSELLYSRSKKVSYTTTNSED